MPSQKSHSALSLLFRLSLSQASKGAFEKTFKVVFSQNPASADAWALTREGKDSFSVS
jgi:hypothetical protein